VLLLSSIYWKNIVCFVLLLVRQQLSYFITKSHCILCMESLDLQRQQSAVLPEKSEGQTHIFKYIISALVFFGIFLRVSILF